MSVYRSISAQQDGRTTLIACLAAGVLLVTLALVGCNYPAAYQITHHGRPTRIDRTRRATMLLWDSVSAQLRSAGWFSAMHPVSSGGWW